MAGREEVTGHRMAPTWQEEKDFVILSTEGTRQTGIDSGGSEVPARTSPANTPKES